MDNLVDLIAVNHLLNIIKSFLENILFKSPTLSHTGPSQHWCLFWCVRRSQVCIMTVDCQLTMCSTKRLKVTLVFFIVKYLVSCITGLLWKRIWLVNRFRKHATRLMVRTLQLLIKILRYLILDMETFVGTIFGRISFHVV